MNKTKIFALIAAAMTFAACSTDNDITSTASNAGEGKAVTIASVTRSAEGGKVDMTLPFHLENTTLAGEGDEDFQADFVYTDGAYATADGSFVAWCNLRGEDGKRVDNVFQAFSPLRTKENRASFSDFFIPHDQSTSEKLQSADWMKAQTTSKVDTDNGSIKLNFEHQHTKLHFNITSFKDDIPNLTSNSFKVINAYTPYYNSEDHTVEAIINEPQVSGYSPIISIEIANGEIISAYPPYDPFLLEPGKQYNFNLAIGHDALTISSVSVTDWTSEPINMESSDAKTDQYDYVTFTAEGEQGFKFVVTPDSEGSLCTIPGFEYSVDNGEWKSIPATGMTEEDEWITFGGGQSSLRLRGKNLNGTSVDNGYSRVSFKDNNVKVACSGDIRTLIDYENYANVDTKNARFIFLFSKCVPLTSAPKLPATDLADYCYAYMFNDCQSLTDAPALPATILADWCYYDMFQRCISLHKAPTLPATDLATGCYAGMFTLCTSLTEAPELPATKLANDCYIGMFTLCTLLTEAPELPATTLANNCYSQMFAVCYSLRKAPDLPAKTLTSGCYNEMFINCITLSEIKMLASNIDNNISPLTGWLNGAGTHVTSRKLIVDSQDTYNGLAGYNLLPDQWKSTETGATVVDKNGNAITDN